MESKEGKPRLRRGFWKPEEDLLLRKYVETHGEGNWAIVSQRSGLKRGAKSCRLRWKNYLRPNIKRGMMSEDEKDLIIRLHKLLGNRWSLIAGRLPGRTDNEVKNYWNTHLNKKRRPQAKRRIVDSKSEDNPRHVNCLESNGERILEESSGGLKDGRRCDSNRWMEEMERLLMDTNDGAGAGAGLGFGDGDGDGLFSNGLEEFGFCDGIGGNEGENYSLEGIQAFLI